MPLKVAGIDDAGNLPARFEARLAAMLTAAKARANHTGTQDAATTLTGLTEAVQDILGSTLVAGTNVDLTYDDGSGTLTITSLGGGGTPGGTDPEGVRDTMAAALTAGANITITPDDVGNTITISSTTDPEMVRDTMAAALLGSGLITVTANDTGNTITLATTATANSSDATLLARANHTGLLPLAGAPSGARFTAPLNGTVNTNAALARPSARTDIFFDWISTVQPTNMRAGDTWFVPA